MTPRLAVTLAAGGDCATDIALLRTQPGVFGPVASDSTVHRTVTAAGHCPGELLWPFVCWREVVDPSDAARSAWLDVAKMLPR